MLTLADSDASLRTACINNVNNLSSYPVASSLFILEAEVMSQGVRERAGAVKLLLLNKAKIITEVTF